MQDPAEDLLQEVIGEGKEVICTDTVSPGKRHGDPPLHTLALHHDDLRIKGRGQGVFEDLRQSVGKDLQSIARIESQSGQMCPLCHIEMGIEWAGSMPLYLMSKFALKMRINFPV